MYPRIVVHIQALEGVAQLLDHGALEFCLELHMQTIESHDPISHHKQRQEYSWPKGELMKVEAPVSLLDKKKMMLVAKEFLIKN